MVHFIPPVGPHVVVKTTTIEVIRITCVIRKDRQVRHLLSQEGNPYRVSKPRVPLTARSRVLTHWVSGKAGAHGLERVDPPRVIRGGNCIIGGVSAETTSSTSESSVTRQRAVSILDSKPIQTPDNSAYHFYHFYRRPSTDYRPACRAVHAWHLSVPVT